MRAGQDYHAFWTMTLRAVALVIEETENSRFSKHDAERARLHELARLVVYAMHSPKEMPAYEPTQREVMTQPPPPTQADDERIRAFFIGLATRGNA